MRPRLLDLFCGAGGCSVGYERAGFDVVGVDIEPHDDYPFPLYVADALEVLRFGTWASQGSSRPWFDVIHASPPCPRYSIATADENRDRHPDLIPPVRELLRAWATATGGIYVIENVVGAPMVDPVLYCGQALGLKHLPRHRLFESNAPLMSPGCACGFGDSVSIFGHSGEDRRTATIARTGAVGLHIPKDEAAALMGVEWMTRREDISDAIPPAYTEHIGSQLIDYLAVAA